jgi:hypothetical protein
MAIFFLGALVATFVLSQLAFLAFRTWDGGWLRLLVAHAISLMLCWAWFTSPPDGKVDLAAGIIFLPPQALWLLVDYLRGRSAREE